jgi:Flp pilus assembly protein CpaB
VTSRGRAVGFAAAAALCAGLAASATGARPADLEAQFGVLQPVLVASTPLPAGAKLSARTLDRAVETRRVPESFVPPGAVADPRALEGRRAAVAIAPGGYIVASMLRSATDPAPADPRLERSERPVEIAVEGAAALDRAAGAGTRTVDVVVTAEAGPGGAPGRTYVAASGVRLLALEPAGQGSAADPLPASPVDAQVATLALSRGQALRLIEAESFARSIRLISH